MANMCGKNSLMEAMIEGGMYTEAERDLHSVGLLGPLQQLYDRRDLPGLISKLAARRGVQRRKDRKALALRKFVIDNMEKEAEEAAEAAKNAVAKAARLATEVGEHNTPEACASRREADETAKSAEEEAMKAKRDLKNAKKNAKKRGKCMALVTGPASAGVPAPANAPAPENAPADAGAPAPVDAAPIHRLRLDTTGPVMKCREEVERQSRLTQYDMLLRLVLRRLRFWRWIWRVWQYKTQAYFLLKEFEAARSKDLSVEVVENRRRALLDLERPLEPNPLFGTVALHRQHREGRRASDHCKALVRRLRMMKYDRWGQDRYGKDWRELADQRLLCCIENVLNRLQAMPDPTSNEDSDEESSEYEDEAGKSLKHLYTNTKESSHVVMGYRKLNYKLSNEKKTMKYLKALDAELELQGGEEAAEHAGWAAYRLSSCFLRLRRAHTYGISTEKHPGRFWPCYDVCPSGGDERDETGSAGQCDNHRGHNMTKKIFRSFDVEYPDNVHSVATAMHNDALGPRVLDCVGLALRPELSQCTDFYKRVAEKVEEQHSQDRGLSMQAMAAKFRRDPASSTQASNPCRWGSGMAVDADLSTRDDLLALGVHRVKCIGKTDEDEIKSAVAIFSDKGWVSHEHEDVILDSGSREGKGGRQQLFLFLVSPKAKVQRCISAFLYKAIVHPLFSVMSDDKRASTVMMGMGGLVRRILRVITYEIWLSTGTMERASGLGHRNDGSKVLFEPYSLRLLNKRCGPAVRMAMGEFLDESILQEAVDAVPLLLEQFRRICLMNGPVVPDTTAQIFAAVKPRYYSRNGRLMDPVSRSYTVDAEGRRNLVDDSGAPMEASFAIKMAQLQFHLRIVILDVVHELLVAFDRELLSPQSFAAGMTTEQWSKGTVDEKRILYADPYALANAAIMRILGRDVVAHMKAQLRTNGAQYAGKHPLDFLQPLAFLWSPKGTLSLNAFSGMARGGEYEYSVDRPLAEPDAAKMMAIARAPEDDTNHFKCVASLGAKDEQGTLIDRVLSQERELTHFAKPLAYYPYALTLAETAQLTGNSSVEIEQPWARSGQLMQTRPGATMSTLSCFHTGLNHRGMNLDILKLVAEEPLLFKAALEVARMPVWKEWFFADEAGLRDALFADHQFWTAAKKGASFWTVSEERNSHRGKRWLNPTQRELNAIANQALQTRRRLGLEQLSSVSMLRKARRTAGCQGRRCRQEEGGCEKGREAERGGEGGVEPLPGGENPSAEDGEWLANAEPLAGDVDPSAQGGEGPAAGAAGAQASEDSHSADDAVADDVDESEGSYSDNGEDIEFGNIDVDHNKYSIQYCYDVFAALTPNHPIGQDTVWKTSLVALKKLPNSSIVSEASVQRRPTTRLIGYLKSLEPPREFSAQFTLFPGSGLFKYIRFCSFAGAQVVSVLSLQDPVPQDNGELDWSRTMRFRRLFETVEAIQHCEADRDQGCDRGKRYLRKFLAENKVENVYHEGDVEFTGDVREIIGVARWYALRQGEPVESTWTECKHADLIAVGDSFRLRLHRR